MSQTPLDSETKFSCPDIWFSTLQNESRTEREHWRDGVLLLLQIKGSPNSLCFVSGEGNLWPYPEHTGTVPSPNKGIISNGWIG